MGRSASTVAAVPLIELDAWTKVKKIATESRLTIRTLLKGCFERTLDESS